MKALENSETNLVREKLVMHGKLSKPLTACLYECEQLSLTHRISVELHYDFSVYFIVFDEYIKEISESDNQLDNISFDEKTAKKQNIRMRKWFMERTGSKNEFISTHMNLIDKMLNDAHKREIIN